MKFVQYLLLNLIILNSSNSQSSSHHYLLQDIKYCFETGEYTNIKSNLHELRISYWDQLNCEEQAIFYKYFGNLYYYQYEDEKALMYYKDSSYQKVQECRINSLENDLLNNIGIIYQLSDQRLLAYKYYEKLRENYLTKEIKLHEKTFHHLVNLASFYEDHADLHRAFLCAWKAKSIGETLNLKLHNVYNLLGIYFERTGQYDEALTNYSKAINSLKSDNMPIPSSLLFNQALTYRFKNDYSQALVILDSLKHQIDSKETFYAIQNLKALIYTDLEEYNKAENIYRKLGLKTTDQGPNYHHENWADLKLKLGDYSGAIDIYKNLIQRLEQKWKNFDQIPSTSPDLLQHTDLLCLLSKAQYLESKNDNRKSRKKTFESYKRIRSNIDELIRSHWESNSSSHLLDELYPNLYFLIMSNLDEFRETHDSTFLELSYNILSQSKNQILERDIQSRITLTEGTNDSILLQYYRLKSNLNVSYLQEPSQTNPLQIQLIEKFEKSKASIDSILSRGSSILSLQPKSIKELQHTLKAGDAFIDIYYAEGRLITYFITNDIIKVNAINLSEDVIYSIMENFKFGKPIPDNLNDSIYLAIFKGAPLKGVKSLTVHPDGLFNKLPLGAIKNTISNRYLIEDFTIRYVLSTDSLYMENYDWSNNLCLGVASDYTRDSNLRIDTIFESFGKLSGTIDELSNLSKYYSTTSLLNQRANFINFSNQILNNKYNVIQLSLHGTLDDRFPSMSGLIFESTRGLELVDLNKLMGLSFDSDLTIINSCHSGNGKHITGEAINSLNTSLFIGGSKSNIVNLWSSSDQASLQILENFHKGISLGRSKSEALQIAKKQFLRSASPSFKHPKYWSSLVIFGNDSPLNKEEPNHLFFQILFVALVLAFAFFVKIRKKSVTK